MIGKNLHAVFNLEYHLVSVTKYRHPVLTDEVKASLLRHTYRLFESNFDYKMLKINTNKDHVHILFSAKPQVQLIKLVNSYKTATPHLLRKEFAEFLEPYYWKPYFWSRSYFICTVSERSHDAVIAYIKNQGNN
jgi:putative transposase